MAEEVSEVPGVHRRTLHRPPHVLLLPVLPPLQYLAQDTSVDLSELKMASSGADWVIGQETGREESPGYSPSPWRLMAYS